MQLQKTVENPSTNRMTHPPWARQLVGGRGGSRHSVHVHLQNGVLNEKGGLKPFSHSICRAVGGETYPKGDVKQARWNDPNRSDESSLC